MEYKLMNGIIYFRFWFFLVVLFGWSVLKDLIVNGVDLNFFDDKGKILLYVLIFNRYLFVVIFLI